jgi:hypothetical protein
MSQHVAGAAQVIDAEERDIHDLDRIQRVCAEVRAAELVDALMSAIAGDPHWRRQAQTLLMRISLGDLPEEPKR